MISTLLKILPVLEMAVLLTASVLLVRRHIRTWNETKEARDPLERDFRWNQFRRRLQISGLTGFVGIGLCAGQYVSTWELFVFVWSTVGLIVLWMLILIFSDILVTRQHTSHMKDMELVRTTTLPGEMITRKDRVRTLSLEDDTDAR